ncbi:MAG: hypothetical protein M3P18_16055 [Actinomycetota bacterium]|nr:hypothetical protein [Actinomycetota bacterium]
MITDLALSNPDECRDRRVRWLATLGVESLVSLEYPNGRIHHATLVGEAVLEPGQEFDLHGRRRRAVAAAKKRRSTGEPQRILCKIVAD